MAFVGLSIPAITGLPPCAGRPSLYAIKQSSDQLRTKDISQLINGISSVIQKLLKCFNGTAISTFSFSRLLFSSFPVMHVL